MYRLKFIIGFVILVILQAAFVVYTLQTKLVPLTDEDTDISLQRSSSLFEKNHQIDELAVKEKARFVASRPDLRKAMKPYDSLQDSVDDSNDSENDENGASDDGDESGSLPSRNDWETQRHRSVLQLLDRDHILFTEYLSRPDVDKQTLFTKFTSSENTDRRNFDMYLLNREPLDHDMFMAIDNEGRLVATLGTGLAHMMGNDIGSQFDTIDDVMAKSETRTDIWNWSWRADEERELYIVALSPMHDVDTGETIGVVVLGNRITSGVADRAKALVTDGIGADDVENMSSREQLQAPEIAYFRGDRLHSTTLPSHLRSQLDDELFERHQILDSEQPEKILDVTLGDHNHRAMVRYFPGQFETDNPAGVVLLTNRDAATAPMEAARSNILFVTAAIVGLGVALFWFLFHLFLQPFGRIEEGIQEVLSGDKDHHFDAKDSHETADNLARHLNLLSAYLQGKPMPDEEQSLGGWGAFGADEPDGPPKKTNISGVPMGLGGGGSSSKQTDSPDDDAAKKTDKEPEETS